MTDTVERRLSICAVTGRVAGDRFACLDCDPCLFGGDRQPHAVSDLLQERDSFALKYEDAVGEINALKAALVRIRDINLGPDRASGEWRCTEAAAIARDALSPKGAS